MVQNFEEELSYSSHDEDSLEWNTTISTRPENNPRRGEEKPRVHEHRSKRYWNIYYGAIQNHRRVQNKNKIKEMKKDIDENGESSLEKYAKSKKKRQKNTNFLKRLKKIECSNDIKDSLHDHCILSGSENILKTCAKVQFEGKKKQLNM